MKTFKVLDTTLRDGSYVNNFSFSAEVTSRICSELDQSGIDFIEVGHGIGLCASDRGHGTAAATDAEYMQAAAHAVNSGKWGMFAIPGICDIDDLDQCFDFDIGFLRFGVPVEDFRQVFPFVEKARTHGVFTCVNFMKSYTQPPQIFERAARESTQAGADLIYLVDSAGNMTPSQVRTYCERIGDLGFGFHGHHNLGLAVANALIAFESGAEVVDCSLQGIGRGAGNTVLEQFVAILQRNSLLENVDLFRLLDLGESAIRPLLSSGGIDSLDLISGIAGFHSSYMNVIEKYSIELDIDPRQLILKVCASTKSSAPEDLVRQKAVEVRAENEAAGFSRRFPMKKYFGQEQS